jgi:hypothetical protein
MNALEEAIQPLLHRPAAPLQEASEAESVDHDGEPLTAIDEALSMLDAMEGEESVEPDLDPLDEGLPISMPRTFKWLASIVKGAAKRVRQLRRYPPRTPDKLSGSLAHFAKWGSKVAVSLGKSKVKNEIKGYPKEMETLRVAILDYVNGMAAVDSLATLKELDPSEMQDASSRAKNMVVRKAGAMSLFAGDEGDDDLDPLDEDKSVVLSNFSKLPMWKDTRLRADLKEPADYNPPGVGRGRAKHKALAAKGGFDGRPAKVDRSDPNNVVAKAFKKLGINAPYRTLSLEGGSPAAVKRAVKAALDMGVPVMTLRDADDRSAGVMSVVAILSDGKSPLGESEIAPLGTFDAFIESLKDGE